MSRPSMRQICDVLNEMNRGDQFTFKTFMDDQLLNAFKVQSARVIVCSATKQGYLSTRKIPHSREHIYTKMKNIPEESMTSLMGHKKKIEEKEITAIDESVVCNDVLVAVDIDDIKKMEDLIFNQDKKINELRKTLAEFIDENTMLNSKIKLMTAKSKMNKNIEKQIRRVKVYHPNINDNKLNENLR